MTDAKIREQVRLLVDPLLMRLREELYGSGITFGKYLQTSVLPPPVTMENEVVPIVLAAGFIKGITTLSGGTTVGTEQKELSFLGPSLSTVGVRTTVDMTMFMKAALLTAAGDLLFRNTSIVTRLPIGTSG